ncbi:MAG TPA: beta-galactosidase [Terriglobia bacterium]|nr:beta-galactosidase [Terriglobia bacterium]
MLKRKELLILGAITLASVCWYPGVRASQGSQGMRREEEVTVPSAGNPIWQAQIDFTKPHDVPWNESDFAALKRSGINRAEINMDWGDIEPQRGRYDFKLLDSYLNETAKAGIKMYLIFWESVWAQKQDKNPPEWLTAREVMSNGQAAQEPPWWDENAQKAYFDYVAHTIDHVKNNPGFGGLYANYGWLDAMWGPRRRGNPGLAGYAPADINAFYRWLPQTYKTLADFNHQWGTSYHSWKDVPVGRPGDPMFAVYQRFRHYSVEHTYGELTHLVREHTNAPVFYYWGGGISGGYNGPGILENDPDTFFRLAKRYNVTVVLDDVEATGNALIFGTAARAYGVSLLQEWTPSRGNLVAEIPQWLSHIGLGTPHVVGESFFIYPPRPNRPGWMDAWKAYQEWHATLAEYIQGRSPEQPVAVLVPTLKIAVGPDLNLLPNLNQELTTFWQHYHVLPHFITDQEVEHGLVSLQQFHAVVDLGDEVSTLPALKSYAENHPVLKSLDQISSYIRPYVTLDPAYDSLEVTATVHKSSAWLTLANCNGKPAYSGFITFDPKTLGLNSVSLDVTDARTDHAIPAKRVLGGKIRWRLNVPSAGFEVVRVQMSQRSATLRDGGTL